MAAAIKIRSREMILILTAFFITPLQFAVGETIYVDDDAGGANDGSSWSNAYAYLQDALGDAALIQEPVEVLVAQGFYKPDQGKNQTPGDRKASFELFSGVSIFGGFAGIREADPGVRDTEAYATILSGDLNCDDIEVNSPYELQAEPTRSENSYHVVTGNGTDNTAVLDGFIIVAGNANGHESDDPIDDKYGFMRGGGMYNLRGSPLVVNCIFSGNSARYGGGIGNWKGNPSIVDCAFVWNSSSRYGGGTDNCEGSPAIGNCTFSENSSSWGGGISNRARSNPTFTNCTFRMNDASWYGGGMINMYSDPTLIGCSFVANTARLGGGMRNSDSSPTLTNCLIVENVAHCPSGYTLYNWSPISGRGGGIYSYKSIEVLINCTISGNRAAESTGGICNCDGAVVMTNCILRGNDLQQISGDAIVSYSNVQGGWPGEGNLDVDPLFVRPDRLEADVVLVSIYNDLLIEGDYHLKSQSGRWDPVKEKWVIDSVSSPCIDSGDPENPCGFEPLPNGGIINMGAYGGTAEASMSLLTVGGITDPASTSVGYWDPAVQNKKTSPPVSGTCRPQGKPQVPVALARPQLKCKPSVRSSKLVGILWTRPQTALKTSGGSLKGRAVRGFGGKDRCL